jgi:tRNA-dihydrouridine synthase A
VADLSHFCDRIALFVEIAFPTLCRADSPNLMSLTKSATPVSMRLSVAPMMECTDRHFRYLVRLISRRTRLYTEMVTANALVHSARAGRNPMRFLAHHADEHPVALQLGGSDPALMAEAAAMGAAAGFDEINLNIGCPSDRVTTGRFGACLMAEPVLVAQCVRAIRERIGDKIPVTVKTRIGIDDQDSDAFLDDFVGTVAAAGCDVFIIHARKAILAGLSPKENREIPPLKYARAVKLKRDFPQLTVILNGGVKTLAEAASHLENLDGVMIGRAAYGTPYALLADADHMIFRADANARSEAEVAMAYLDYAAREEACGTRLHLVTRHALGLFAGRPGARAWRRALSEVSASPSAADSLRKLGALVNYGGAVDVLTSREQLAA